LDNFGLWEQTFFTERIFPPTRVEKASRRRFHVLERAAVEFSSWESRKHASRLLYVPQKK